MAASDRLAQARDHLALLNQSTLQRYREGRRVLSLDEYLDLFASSPIAYGRDASRYLRDVFDYYGSEMVQKPWGQERRFKLFDLPWEADGSRREALVGQEHIQQEIYRTLCNFAREGRANRLILLHGPNGSAKSTVASCLFRALEQYSTLEEGALYRFHWVFPSQKTIRGSIGFGGEGERKVPASIQSYAHLDETQIDARLQIEIRDHPLFLLPVRERRELLLKLWADVEAQEAPPEWLLKGQLNKKNQQIFEALLATYKGDLREVFRHVQVERYFLSHRYRVGAVTIGPQMSVDAGEAQITADRSLTALPTALQATTLFEARGELIDAQGGLLEFSDILKRPIDAFKYLQLSIETSEVALNQQNVQLNCVMLASANEVHLDAFREHHEFPSFRGRFELIRAPYLLSYLEEKQIYDNQILPQIPRPVAPHATRMAAMFAVLTRMRKPAPDRFHGSIAAFVGQLSAFEKMEIYATGTVPERLGADDAKLLRAHISDLYRESLAEQVYEGRLGASPREIRSVLFNAAQSHLYEYLSPLAVLDEIKALCNRKSEFAWLQEEPLINGFHDVHDMLSQIRSRLYDTWEEEFRIATGLVDEAAYDDLFERYIAHVSAWIKGEKLRNRVTGDYENPEVHLMNSAENLLGVTSNPEDFRRGLISAIAAWAIDHPGQKIDPAVIFPHHVRKMRMTVFAERRQAVALLCRDTVKHLRDGVSSGLDAQRQEKIQAFLSRLQERFGYSEVMARDAASALVRWRFAELVTLMSTRVLGAGSLLALGLNGVIGVGIFFLPATLASKAPGSSGLLILFLTSLALTPVALTFAALARHFDQDGGPVLYARAAFGDKIAFLTGWIAYLSAIASTAAVLAGLCHYSLAFWYLLEGPSEHIASIVLALILATIVSFGLRFSALVWNLLTILKLTPLVALVLLVALSPPSVITAVPSQTPLSLSSGLGAALLATFAFQGFEIVPLVAGHARGEDRTIPRATVGALGIAALLYILLHWTCLLSLPDLATSKAPLVDAAIVLGGSKWGDVLSLGANLSALGIAFGMMAMTPRYLAALAPEFNQKIAVENARGVPLRALWISVILITILLSLGSLAELFVLSSVAVLAQYGVTALALIRLASQAQRGLRRQDLWPAPLALLITIALMSSATLHEILIAIVAILLGILWKWWSRFNLQRILRIRGGSFCYSWGCSCDTLPIFTTLSGSATKPITALCPLGTSKGAPPLITAWGCSLWHRHQGAIRAEPTTGTTVLHIRA